MTLGWGIHNQQEETIGIHRFESWGGIGGDPNQHRGKFHTNKSGNILVNVWCSQMEIKGTKELFLRWAFFIQMMDIMESSN